MNICVYDKRSFSTFRPISGKFLDHFYCQVLCPYLNKTTTPFQPYPTLTAVLVLFVGVSRRNDNMNNLRPSLSFNRPNAHQPSESIGTQMSDLLLCGGRRWCWLINRSSRPGTRW